MATPFVRGKMGELYPFSGRFYPGCGSRANPEGPGAEDRESEGRGQTRGGQKADERGQRTEGRRQEQPSGLNPSGVLEPWSGDLLAAQGRMAAA
jgi:hypothetical protein